jgi:hypothetical protein
MKRSAIISLTLLLAALASASSSSAQTGEIRTVPLVVMNQTGQIIQGLTRQNVRMKRGKASVQSIVLDIRPRRIVLLIDMSESMSAILSENKHITALDYAKDTAKVFLQTLLRQDSVALDVFADKERQIVPFTHDFASITAAINALPQPRGRTFAGDALQAALRDFGTTTGFGDSVVFFSDGQFDDDFSRRLIGPQIPDMARCGVRAFLIFPMASHIDLPSRDSMTSISSVTRFMFATGGLSFTPERLPEDWPAWEIVRPDPIQRVAALSNAIHGTYRVELQFADAIRKKQKLQLDVIDDKGKNMRNVYALYPHTIYPAIDSRRP